MQGATIEKPEFLGERHVKLVDASDETTKGKEKSTWRLHYVFDLFEFQCASMELTTNKEGERLTRHEVNEKDILIADRIYCTMSGTEHVLSSKGDFVLRFKSKAFHLYNENSEPLDLLPSLRQLKCLENTEVNCYYKLNGELRPLRIVAMKKDRKAIAESKRRMSRKVSKKQEKAVQADTIELNEYVVLATSLDYTNDQILELYRARWQVEQVFYRLKSLFGYAEVPSKREDTVKAWFYGKLLLAALCESILKRMSFPPNSIQSLSILLERSLWTELGLILRWVAQTVWDFTEKITSPHDLAAFFSSFLQKRRRLPALKRLFCLRFTLVNGRPYEYKSVFMHTDVN